MAIPNRFASFLKGNRDILITVSVVVGGQLFNRHLVNSKISELHQRMDRHEARLNQRMDMSETRILQFIGLASTKGILPSKELAEETKDSAEK